MRTREGMAVAKAKGRLRGKQPKLSGKQQTELRRMQATGDHSITDLAEPCTIGRATVYRTLRRDAAPTAQKVKHPPRCTIGQPRAPGLLVGSGQHPEPRAYSPERPIADTLAGIRCPAMHARLF